MYKILICLLLFSACSTKQDIDLTDHKIEGFVLEKYLGKWKEVERIDNRFEKGLVDATANYYIEDGKIVVLNKGWNPKKNRYKGSIGYIKETEVGGYFKVSFFRPFYGDYVVLDVDETYSYALVGGGTSEYLWILSRDREIPKDLRERFIEKAKELGYSYEKLKKY